LKCTGEKQKKRLQALELYAKSHTTIPQDEVTFSTPTSTAGQDVAGMLGMDSPIMVLPDLLQHHSLPIPDVGINDIVSGDPSLNTAPSSHQVSGHIPAYDDYIPSSSFQVDHVEKSSRSFQEELFSVSERPASIAGSNAIIPESSLSSSTAQQRHREAHGDSEADTILARFLLQDDVTLSRGLLRDIQKHKITLRDVLRLGLQSLGGKSYSTTESMRVTESLLQQHAYRKSIAIHFSDLIIYFLRSKLTKN
jgi:hypothetical protein